MNRIPRSQNISVLKAYPAIPAAKITVPTSVRQRFAITIHHSGLPPAALSHSNSGRKTNA